MRMDYEPNQTRRHTTGPVATLQGANAIEVKDLVIRYHSKVVMKVEGLKISRHGVTSLLGPSGCGKSSLLKVLCHFCDESLKYDGEILDFGAFRPKCCSGMPYAMIWQLPLMYPCSLFDNLALPLKKRCIAKAQWHGMIEEKLASIGIIDELGKSWKDVRADKLSGGQKQRISIVRSLLQDAKMMFLDEPCSALDPTATERVETVIRKVAESVPVVIVTHNIGQARRISDHAAVFCADNGVGYLCEQGPAKQCLFEPVSNLSRRFLLREVGV